MNDIFFFFTRISETRNVNEDDRDRKGKRNSRKERSANDSECVDRG